MYNNLDKITPMEGATHFFVYGRWNTKYDISDPEVNQGGWVNNTHEISMLSGALNYFKSCTDTMKVIKAIFFIKQK